MRTAITRDTWGKKWDFTLDLSDLWKIMRDIDKAIGFDELGAKVAERVRKSDFFGEYDDNNVLVAICDELESLDDEASAGDFDYRLKFLYDWCDIGKRVWVETW